MKKFYRVCQQNIELITRAPVEEIEDWEKFEVLACEPDIKIDCAKVSQLPQRRGEYKPSGDDFCVCSVEADVERRFVAVNKDSSLAQYSICEKPECSVYVTEDMWSAIMDRRYMWSVAALPYLMIMRRAVLVHASYIDIGGQGIIFSAPCGTGKSTQAALWEKCRGAKTVNGDKCGLTAEADGVTVHGVPFAGSSGICNNVSLPLKAIVILKQAPQNSIKRLSGAVAVKELLGNVYHDKQVPAECSLLMRLIVDISDKIPIYELACTPDERAVEELEKVLDFNNIR